MPIKPENKAKYPDNWKAIRASILKRAGDRCELCFLENGSMIQRAPSGAAFPLHINVLFMPTAGKRVKVVLTIAHINQDPTDNRPVNLRALCQRCHNLIDLPYRTKNAAATRAARKDA